MESRLLNPLLDFFSEIEKILDFMEVKDLREAMKYETPEMKGWAEAWLGAKLETDNFATYARFWEPYMFQEVVRNVHMRDIERWMKSPFNTPMEYREHLLHRGRAKFFDAFEETNSYYLMLQGLPPHGTPSSEYVLLSPELSQQFNAPIGVPVHKLSTLIQNRYMLTEDYRKELEEHPDRKYLKYMGLFKIDPLRARTAKDFEIIRYIPMDRSDINPNLLKEFGRLYAEYRDYVMITLYNKHMEGVYENYRGFMGMLIQSFALMQISNKAVEHVVDRRFLDDTVLHIILSKYGIPRSLLLTKEVRRNLVTNLLRITREKATDVVYDSLVEVLGYHDVIISKLMIMRGQEFDEDPESIGQTRFANGDRLNTFEDMEKIINKEEKLKVNPYFLAIDIKDPNPYDTIVNGNPRRFEICDETCVDQQCDHITQKDPRWWNLEDTRDLLNNRHYTIADSKYIMVEAVIHQMRYMFESMYFSRMIIDNRKYTEDFFITIPEIFGTEPMSLYDLMIFLITANGVNNGFNGEIIQRDEMLIVAGFNFDIDLDLFAEFVHSSRYVDVDRLMGFLENLSMRTPSDINRLFNEVISPLREWLELKISQSEIRQEFLEYEKIYRALFTYDGARPAMIDSFKSPMELIQEKYGLTDMDLLAFKSFYPHEYQASAQGYVAIKQGELATSRYAIPVINPQGIFIRPSLVKSWYIETSKGPIYLWDILNSPDLRYTEYFNNGTSERFQNRIFYCDDDESGLEIDTRFVEEVIGLLNGIDGLPATELSNAFFPITVSPDGKIAFNKGTLLPPSIRSENFRNILADKVRMDMEGLAQPSKTYQDYLKRKNPALYNLLPHNRPEPADKESWLNDVMTIVIAVETELDMHMKYFEQSVVGSELFFRPLITLIGHFKSTFVDFAKTGLRWVFGDKMDAGGNSNMLKMFDSMRTFIHWLLLSRRGEAAEFGLYDTEHWAKYRISLDDKPTETRHGSIKMFDEMKFFKNGEEIDPRGKTDPDGGGDLIPWPHHSAWYPGEPNSGRWEQDHDFIMRTRFDTENVQNEKADLEAWSYLQEEE